MKLLLAGKAEVDAKDNKGYTPLHWAADEGKEEAVFSLLQNKAEVNAKDNNGYTPLHYAAQNSHKEAAALMRQYGGHE